MEFRSIAADGPGTVGAGLIHRTATHPRRGIASGLAAIAAGAWAIAAPLLFGADEAADWGWHATTLAVGPGLAAVLGGCAMVSARPRPVRWGGWLAVAAGLLLLGGALAGPLWAGDHFGSGDPFADSIRLLIWIGFFALAGLLVAAAGAYALGVLDTPPWERVRRRSHSRCEARRRRASATLERPQTSARRRHAGGG